MDTIKSRMIDKSIEAFILGLEVYNKPTIRYRIEGFSFFVINAWELMLKAELLNRGVEIYYKDKPNRSLSISDTIKKVYSDKDTRIRLNLERIVDLRNTSTHFITEDHEVIYAPLFQSCVLNYVHELKRFHDCNIEDYISQNFLTITANYAPLDNEQIRLKYSPDIAERLIREYNEIDTLSETYNSDKFSIQIKQNLYVTKKKEEADFTVRISKDSDNNVAPLKELKDPANTHKYSFNSVIAAVHEDLKKKNIRLGYKSGFNKYVLQLVIDFYNVKENERFAYPHIIGNSCQFTYSQQFIEFIVDEIKKNPETFVESLKKEN